MHHNIIILEPRCYIKLGWCKVHSGLLCYLVRKTTAANFMSNNGNVVRLSKILSLANLLQTMDYLRRGIRIVSNASI
jgi:hypothetical protein